MKAEYFINTDQLVVNFFKVVEGSSAIIYDKLNMNQWCFKLVR